MARRWLMGTLCVIGVVCALQRCTGIPQLIDDETGNADLVRAALLVSDMLNNSGPAAFTRLDADNVSDPSACTVLFDGITCNAGVRTYSFTDGNGRGCPLKTGLEVFGSTTLTFSDASCDDGVDGTIDRTVANHYFQRTDNGKKYLVYSNVGTIGNTFIVSDDLKTYRGDLRSGGNRVTVASGVNTLMVNGVHQWSVFNNAFGLHHTLYTDATQSIDVALSGPEATLNGFATLSQNRSDLTYIVEYINARLGVSCRYPISGDLVFYRQGNTLVTPTPTPTSTAATPTPTETPTPGGPTPTPTNTPTPVALVYPIEGRIDVSFPGTCGEGIIRVDSGPAETVELLP